MSSESTVAKSSSGRTEENTNSSTFTQAESINFPKTKVTKAEIEDKQETENLSKHEERKKEMDYINCVVHNEKKNDMYCRTCQKAICERCGYLNHRTHKLADLWEIISEKEKQLTLEIDILKFQIQWKYKEKILEMETEYMNLNEIYSQIRRAIRSTAEDWHKEVDNIINDFLSSVDNFEEKHRTHVHSEIKKLENIMNQIENLLEENEKLLATPLELARKEVPKIEKFKRFPQVSHVNPPAFTVGTLQEVIDYQVQLEETEFHSQSTQIPYNAAYSKSCICLADLKALSERRYPEYEIQTGITNRPKFSNPSIKIPNHKSLNDIHALSEEKAFVSDLGRCVSLIDRKGNVQTSQELEGIQFLSIGKNNDMYYTDSDGKRIIKMKYEEMDIHDSDERRKEMLTATEVSTEDWVPKGLTITRSGYIMVCLQSEGSGKIAKYSQNLEKEDFFQSENLQCHVEKPERIVENKNGDICVTDMGGEKFVYIFYENGNVRNKYRPITASNFLEGLIKWRDASFSPEGICTDRMGHILISDTPNRVIHILNQWGEFLQYFLRDYLNNPRAMSIDESGHIWLLEGKEKMKIVKYLNGFL